VPHYRPGATVSHSPGPFVTLPIPPDDDDLDFPDAAFLICEKADAGDALLLVLDKTRRGTPADNARLFAAADWVPHFCEVAGCPGAALLALLTEAAAVLRKCQYGGMASRLEVVVAASRQDPRR